jgi:ATP-dependent protease HslVU (ClpYQ) peptidase subunit
MTTIVYKDGILAADTQLTTGDLKSRIRKIHKLPDGRVCAGAGNVSDWPMFFEWLQKAEGKKVKVPDLAKGFEMLVLEENGKAGYYNNKCLYFEVDDPLYTNGSGWAIARAGLICGLNAKKAVELAGQIDTNTNTIVDTYDIKKKRLTLSKFT